MLLLAFSIHAAAAPGPEASTARALVDRYCTGCHNDRSKIAGISLQSLDLSQVWRDAGMWENVLRKVVSGQMPPSGSPRAPLAATSAFTGYLRSELDHYAASHPNPGQPTIHRLNRAEYGNTVRDLLAVEVDVASKLPPDDSGYGFDNIGDVLSLSPVLIERYLSAASQVSRLAIGEADIKPKVDVFTPAREARAVSRAWPKFPREERLAGDLPFGASGGVSIPYHFPADAEYTFRIKMPVVPPRGDDTVSPPAEVLEMRVPVKAGDRQVVVTFLRSGAVQELVPGIDGSVAAPAVGPGSDPGDRPRFYMDLRLDGARLKLHEVRQNNFAEVSIGGPYNVGGPGDTPSRRIVFVCRPATPDAEEPCARRVLSSLARRAYRRPITDADVIPLVALYRQGRADGAFDAGIAFALRGLLVSPNFLFRIERDPSGSPRGSAYRIGEFELASRLSYFLWSSMPDEELLRVAEQRRLKEPAVLAQQISRMLADPKSGALVNNFAGQYLYLRNLAALRPDPQEFPRFDAALRRAFEQETRLFFADILRENRPVTELLDARFTYLNQNLAGFYGVPGVYGPQFRRVDLADPQRGGILGQASLLTVTSYPNRTSVVQRGRWVLDNLLGTPPPPPPANVPALEPHGKDGKLSMRQAMEEHRANPVCASCHSRMDPIGFALENYDGIGAWRDRDRNTPIDASGKFPDGVSFSGSTGLKSLLLTEHRDEFILTFAEKLMIYALGRGLESYDRPALRSILREAGRNNNTIPALIGAIVNSPQFQMRRTREP